MAPKVAGLHQQFMSDLPGHIGQPEITALEPEGQLGVVDAKQVQDSGLEVIVKISSRVSTDNPLVFFSRL